MSASVREAILITATCTTGWLDWVHGQLWLCPHGLVRVRSGWGQTFMHGESFTNGVTGTVDPSNRPRVEIDDRTIEAVRDTHRTNHWIPKGEIEKARFRRGIITARLLIRPRDGRTVKFLWVNTDGGFELLSRWLGRRLVTG